MKNDKLKQAREKRQALLDEMEPLTKKEELTEAEEQRYDEIVNELEEVREEIPKLEKREKANQVLAEQRAQERAAENNPEKRAIEDANQRKDETEVRGGENAHLKTKEARDEGLVRLIIATARNDHDGIKEQREKLLLGGHYEKREGQVTYTDGGGGVFLPTSTSNEVLDMEREFGVVPRLSLNLGDLSKGSIKVPEVLSIPTMTAVNEKGTIAGSSVGFGGIQLTQRKWGVIVDWTNEISDGAGAKIMPIIMRKVAEAAAQAKDNAFINGDGTSTYNSIKGLIGLVGSVNYVRKTSAASGNTAFATVDADDWLDGQYDLAPGARSGAVYITHPNQEQYVRKLKDGQGRYIYGDPSDQKPFGSIFGRAVYFTEAFPVTDGSDVPFAAVYNPSFLGFGQGKNLTVKELTEATITDEDSNTFNLATQDGSALRFTELFDIVLSQVTRTTAGTAQGAFSVLYTA